MPFNNQRDSSIPDRSLINTQRGQSLNIFSTQSTQSNISNNNLIIKAGETINKNRAVGIKPDGLLYHCTRESISNIRYIGISIQDGAIDSEIEVQSNGIILIDGNFNEYNYLYYDNTGVLTETALTTKTVNQDIIQAIGIAISVNTILLDVSEVYLLI